MKTGQTLIILLVFMTVALTIGTAGVMLAIAQGQASGRQVLSSQAYDVAESGLENALILLLRNPNYSGDTLTVGEGIATITVTGGTNIISVGQVGDYIRTLRVIISYNGGVMTISSWQEIYP